MLRQFCVTETNAGFLLMYLAIVMELLGLTLGHENIKKEHEWFVLLRKSWFSSKVSTEAMMWGSTNEPAVLSALKSQEVIKVVFEVGILSMKNACYLACSPGAVAFVDIGTFLSAPLLKVYRELMDGEL